MASTTELPVCLVGQGWTAGLPVEQQLNHSFALEDGGVESILRVWAGSQRVSATARYGFDGALLFAHHRQVQRRHAGAVKHGGETRRLGDHSLNRLGMAEPRRQMQGRVPGLVLPPQDGLLLPTVPRELDEDGHGDVMPGPGRAVQRRVLGRVRGGKQAPAEDVPEPGV